MMQISVTTNSFARLRGEVYFWEGFAVPNPPLPLYPGPMHIRLWRWGMGHAHFASALLLYQVAPARLPGRVRQHGR